MGKVKKCGKRKPINNIRGGFFFDEPISERIIGYNPWKSAHNMGCDRRIELGPGHVIRKIIERHITPFYLYRNYPKENVLKTLKAIRRVTGSKLGKLIYG